MSPVWISRDCCASGVKSGGPWRTLAATLGFMLRGTAAGLEFIFAERAFDGAWSEIAERLAERPDFYRGSQAAAIFEGAPPGDAEVASFALAVLERGIALRGLYGSAAVEELAGRLALPYLGEPPRSSVTNFDRKRAARAGTVPELTEAARSLDADFAGARADIAQRRKRGEASVPRPVIAPAAASLPSPLPDPAATGAVATPTLYHRGTVRGGRALQQLGTIVVVGDVNPGAELVASGDIVVFGSLRGTAHAGAQGDVEARVYALELAPTQLRIATFIGSGDPGTPRAPEPEVAFVAGERIAIAALGAAELGR